MAKQQEVKFQDVDQLIKRVEQAKDRRGEFFEILGELPFPSLLREDFILLAKPWAAPGPYSQKEFSVLQPLVPPAAKPELSRIQLRRRQLQEARVEELELARDEWSKALNDLRRAKLAPAREMVDGSRQLTESQLAEIGRLQIAAEAAHERFDAAALAATPVEIDKALGIRHRQRATYEPDFIIRRK